MSKILFILVPLFLTLNSCNSDKNNSLTSRYSTQTFSVAGGMSVITQVTDHQVNKVYLYKMGKEGLTLQDTIDLEKCGDQKIPFERNQSK